VVPLAEHLHSHADTKHNAKTNSAVIFGSFHLFQPLLKNKGKMSHYEPLRFMDTETSCKEE